MNTSPVCPFVIGHCLCLPMYVHINVSAHLQGLRVVQRNYFVVSTGYPSLHGTGSGTPWLTVMSVSFHDKNQISMESTRAL